MLFPKIGQELEVQKVTPCHEVNSDAPAVFYAVIENGEIVYMEYSLML